MPSSSAVCCNLRLAPPLAAFGSASDRTSGFHRRRYLPATPSDRYPTFIGTSSFGPADEELSVFTGCSIVSLRWRLTSCFRKRPDLPVSPAH
jgi:hypothetical protein